MVVASLGEVAASVSAACDKASKCKDALAAAQDLTEDAEALFAMALEGDTTGDKDKILASLAEVVTGVRHLWKTLAKGMDHAQAALDTIQGRPAPGQGAVARLPVPAAPAGPVPPDPAVVPTELVEVLRRELPAPVVPGSGQKTHGRWIARTVRSIQSSAAVTTWWTWSITS